MVLAERFFWGNHGGDGHFDYGISGHMASRAFNGDGFVKIYHDRVRIAAAAIEQGQNENQEKI